MHATNKDVLKIFWSHTRKYKWRVVVLVFAIVISVLMDLLAPWYLKQFFDGLSTLAQTTAGLLILTPILLKFFATRFVLWIGQRVNNIFATYLQAPVTVDLQQTAFDYTLYHSHSFFSNTFAGSLVRKMGRLSRSYDRMAEEIIYRFIPVALILVGTTVGLGLRYHLIAGIFVLWSVIFLVLNYAAALWKMKIDVERAAADSKVTGILADAVGNSATITLFATEKKESKNLRSALAGWLTLQLKSWNRGEIIEASQGFLMVIIEVGLIWYAAVLWSRELLTLGDIVLIQGYLAAVFWRLWDMGRGFRNIFESFADAREMVEILNEPHEIQDVVGAVPLKVKEGRITFDHVSFQFHNRRKVLDSFNLHIVPREKVALVGVSGAGKSTLTKLLLRLYEVNKGHLLIDGQDISKMTQESLRKNIAMVPQDPLLFHRTLKENIRYAKPNATDKEIIDAAKKAHCHEFIVKLPEGYDTYVGERGVKLSGGERQRVAIARAILKNAPILLLDEATSSLDSQSESLIQHALAHLMKDKTVIVIAHRLSTIMQMDRIVVMEEGRVVSSGTHHSLYKKGGVYKKLWDIQAGGFLLE